MWIKGKQLPLLVFSSFFHNVLYPMKHTKTTIMIFLSSKFQGEVILLLDHLEKKC